MRPRPQWPTPGPSKKADILYTLFLLALALAALTAPHCR